MLPGVDGFSWSAGHVIFIGAFFTVAAVIGTTVILALMRVIRDFRSQKSESIRWKVDFQDLPVPARACRHQLTGEAAHRTCENGFECGCCSMHPVFLQARESAAAAAARQQGSRPFGLEMPRDRMYHRGHTWVRPEADGQFVVGMDDFGARVLGRTDHVELPEKGALLHANGTACKIRKGSAAVRILSPLDGEVTETAAPDAGWLFKLKPVKDADTRHLLREDEVRPWILREIERLEFALSSGGVGLSLADGGEIVNDLPTACPGVNWQEIWRELFLEP
jgi:glycine cleavage system H lipoate-binding protein